MAEPPRVSTGVARGEPSGRKATVEVPLMMRLVPPAAMETTTPLIVATCPCCTVCDPTSIAVEATGETVTDDPPIFTTFGEPRALF